MAGGRAIHRPLVQMADATRRPARARDVAEDDHLCSRVRHCTLCGRGAAVGHYTALVYVGARVIAALRCTRCAVADPGLATLHRFLARRYGEE